MNLDFGGLWSNLTAWYGDDEQKENIFRVGLFLWTLLQTINLGLLGILWQGLLVSEWGYAAFVCVYFFPALGLSTYGLLQCARHATLVEYKRLALTDLHTI